ncbi:hypothetical protein EYF80_029234 [Liparis tanakae]|uniref:Uncharacterized protein n=1 Tax=Liparis tanakae TaxID=230148 RepID=A0A4Z2H4F9_9TELE|nr:hypothetical protein EYF80_029234 [Liparis tanakae]
MLMALMERYGNDVKGQARTVCSQPCDAVRIWLYNNIRRAGTLVWCLPASGKHYREPTEGSGDNDSQGRLVVSAVRVDPGPLTHEVTQLTDADDAR